MFSAFPMVYCFKEASYLSIDLLILAKEASLNNIKKAFGSTPKAFFMLSKML